MPPWCTVPATSPAPRGYLPVDFFLLRQLRAELAGAAARGLSKKSRRTSPGCFANSIETDCQPQTLISFCRFWIGAS